MDTPPYHICDEQRERGVLTSATFTAGIFQPLRHYVTPPLYFAIQNTGEEFKSEPIPKSWISSTQPETRHFIVSTGLLDSSPLY